MDNSKPYNYYKDLEERAWFDQKVAEFEAIGMQWIGLPIGGFMSIDGKVWGNYIERLDAQTKESWPEYLAFYKGLIDKDKN